MYTLIMAGGIGSRFWPRSRQRTPKHLLSIINNRSMLENTILRMDELVKRSDCYIITNAEQKSGMMENLRDFNEENIISEPFGRNTAAAIGYGAIRLMMKDPEAVMIVLPADHYIRNTALFRSILLKAVDYCRKDPEALVTIGIEPTHPETGYGYIQLGSEIDTGIYEVRSFAEKPNVETAVRFLESGDFFWNSGMFVWKADTILKNIKKHIPDLYESLMDLKSALEKKESDHVIERIYSEMRSISIDYGVMENAGNVKVLIGNFGWSDVGSWLEIYRLKEKDGDNNVVECDNFFQIDTRNCLISTEDREKVVAVIGQKDIALIDTGDALLISPLSRSQEVKDIVEMIKVGKIRSVL